MQVILNIGLDNVPVNGETYTNGRRNPAVMEQFFTAVQTLRSHGFKIIYATMHQSDSEPTLVTKVDDNNMSGYNRITKLAEALNQDCIATYNPVGKFGELYGPRAAAWGEFNPAFFIMPDGSRLGAAQVA